jgi:hypothetical protein
MARLNSVALMLPPLGYRHSLKAQPNQPVNLTRNGVRQSAGKVSCAHSSSPAACRTPLRSGYRQR